MPTLNQTVGRRRQYRIDLRLAHGSVTGLDARAYVLGVFRNVTPGGPANALDQRLGGAIKDFTVRRMFAAHNGEIFIMPTGRHPLPADFLIFAGLGDFDRFNDSVLQLAAENVVRTCVEEIGTVLLGAGSGHDIPNSLRNLLIGFFRWLRDVDTDHRSRRITIGELNPERYEIMKVALL